MTKDDGSGFSTSSGRRRPIGEQRTEERLEKIGRAAEGMERAGKAMEKAGCAMTKFGCSLIALVIIVFLLWVYLKP